MVFWLAIIGLAEFPINAIVFEVVGEELWLTYIMAAGLGVLIPLFAHFFAEPLKQTTKSVWDKVLIVLSPMVLLGLLAFIGVFRAKYLEIAEEQGGLDIHLTPAQSTVLFILVNLTFFFVAVLISYAGSYPDKPEHKLRKRKLVEARRVLQRESSEAVSAGQGLEKAEQVLQRAKNVRQKEFESYVARANSLKENNDFYVALYRAANMAARESRGKPPCFNRDPRAAQIPPVLKPNALDWDCEDGGERFSV
jgi:hypothetical protein